MLALEQCSAPILRSMVIQPIRIISMLNEPTNFCRVCGLEQPYPQYGESGRVPTFEICPCCGVDFGYEDATIAGTVRFRNAWMAEGRSGFIQTRGQKTGLGKDKKNGYLMFSSNFVRKDRRSLFRISAGALLMTMSLQQLHPSTRRT